MRSICFFSSYFTQTNIPYYVKCYLAELTRHFDEVILITSAEMIYDVDKQFLFDKKIEIMLVKNEGFDFGMWYKAFKKFDMGKYERVGLINDSCILFKKLDSIFEIINKNEWDYCGIIDSEQIAYHLQSYFVIINKRAIELVKGYFIEHGIMEDFDEVINTYEVGVTQFLLKSNLKIGSVYSHSICYKGHNPSFSCIDKLLKAGFPMLKKKIIFGNYREGEVIHLYALPFRFNKNYYFSLIAKSREPLIIDFDLLKNDYHSLFSEFKMLKRALFSKSYKMMRFVYRKMQFR